MDGGMNGVEGRGRIREIWTQGRKGGKEEKGEKGEAEEAVLFMSEVDMCMDEYIWKNSETTDFVALGAVCSEHNGPYPMQGKGWKATERDDYAD